MPSRPEADIKSFRGANLLVPRPSTMLEMALPDWPSLQDREQSLALAESLRRSLRLGDGLGAWEELAKNAAASRAEFLGVLLALTALGLQRRVGRQVSHYRAVSVEGGKKVVAVWEHFIGYEGQSAGRCALELVHGLATAGTKGRGAKAKQTELAEAMVAKLRAEQPDPVADVIMEGMQARALPWRIFDHQWPGFEVGYGHKRQRLMTSMPDGQSHLDRMVFRNKFIAAAILREAGLPMPEHELANSAEKALAAAERIGYPVVVKPVDAGRSRGVTVNLQGPEGVSEAYAFAREHGSSVLVERFIPGLPYRILILEGQVIAAALRGIPSVTGDGKASVAELIERENARREEENLSLSQPLPKINVPAFAEECDRRLAEQDLTLDGVPAAGQEVWLAHHAQRGRGGLNVDVTAELHPDHFDMAAQIAAIMRCPMIGIDFISQDIRRSFREVPCGINEVNIEPALNLHMRMTRTPRDVVAPLLETLFPGGENGRIPMLSVHGTAPAPLGLLRRAVAAAGLRLGFASRDGALSIGTEAIDLHGTIDQRIGNLLFDPRVEALLLELCEEDFNRGFAFDRSEATLCLFDPGQAERSYFSGAKLLRNMTAGPLILPLDALEAWQAQCGRLRRPAILFGTAENMDAETLAGLMSAGHRIVAPRAGAAGSLGVYHDGLFDLFAELDAGAKADLQREGLLAAAGLLGLGFTPQQARRCLSDVLAEDRKRSPAA